MCGIAGIFRSQPAADVDRDVLRRMADRLAHRGPDGAKIWASAGAGMAFTRLAIVDVGAPLQPFRAGDERIVGVCNGEIYNHQELRRRLEQRGVRFRTNCDVEVLVHLYEHEGAGFVAQLHGQFAFAIYDGRDHSMLCGRDHFGIAPLFYARVGDDLVFGSEIKAVLCDPRVSRELDLEAVDLALAMPGIPPPWTIAKGVRSLGPGEVLRFDRHGALEVERYWDLTFSEPGKATEAELVEELDVLLQQAVRRRLQGDVPVDLYLSGGLDSSLVAALAARHGQRRSYSITFDDPALTEVRYQREVAEKLGTLHAEFKMTPEQVAERLQRVVWYAETPLLELFDSAAMALAELARSCGTKTVLGGQGADELFAGYVGYRFDRLSPALAEVDAWDAMEDARLQQAAWGDPGFVYERRPSAARAQALRLYAERLRGRELVLAPAGDGVVIPAEELDGLQRRTYLDVRYRLSSHLLADHGDRMSYASGVELRHPFLDLDVAKFASRLHPRMKVRDLSEKYLLKQVAKRYLPTAIVEREKFGFVAGGAQQLLDYPCMQDYLSVGLVRRHAVFDPDFVEALKGRYRAPGFFVNAPFEIDYLAFVATFNMLAEQLELQMP